MLKYALVSSVGVAVAFLLTPHVAALAHRLQAVDMPGGRRQHAGAIPRLGGLAIVPAVLVALAVGLAADRYLLTLFASHGTWGWVLMAALVVTVCGVADDVLGLGPVAKLAMQVLAGVLVLAGGYGIWVVSNPFGGPPIALGWLGLPITLLWVIGVTNAFNLIDGLDGLASGVGLIASVTIVAISLTADRVDTAIVAVALAGALAGFLYHNFHPATVFLGDSGALFLGFVLSVLSIEGAHKGATAVIIAVPILALGLPIADTILAMLRRALGALHVVRVDPNRNEYRFLVIGSASIVRADRDHIHHRLLRMGLTYERAVVLLYGVCVALGTLAFLAVTVRGAQLAVLVGVTAMAMFFGLRRLGYQEVDVLRRGTLLPLFDSRVFSRRSFHATVDAGFLGLAYIGAVLLASGGLAGPGTRAYLVWTVLPLVALKVGLFLANGVYYRAYRYTNAGDVLALVKALVMAEVVAASAVVLVYGFPARPLLTLVLDFYFAATLVLGGRLSFRFLEVLKADPATHARPVLVYGANAGGAALLRETAQNPDLGFRVVGFLDDPPAMWRSQVNGVPVLGGLQHLPELARQHGVEEVILAHHAPDPAQVRAVASACTDLGLTLRRFRFSFEEVGNDAIAAVAANADTAAAALRTNTMIGRGRLAASGK